MESNNKPLKVLIAGAGIAGLTAAIGLRRQGHEVILFERSQLAQETAAAIHLAPNCHVILRRLGIKPETFGANPVNGFVERDMNGKVKLDLDLRQALKIWEQPWVLTHRARLHDELKRVATQEEAPGIPAVIHTSSKVINVDCSTATVKLSDESSFTGDIVIGADGVGSATRAAVAGPEIRPFGSGKSAFRFLIPCSKIRGDSETEHFVRRDGFMTVWYGYDRRLVMYPCEHNSIMNFVAIHPTEITKQAVTGGWNATVSKQLLLDVYRSFGEVVATLLNLVDEKDLKIWELLDMAQLPTWVNDRAALIGDAAHPFLPHQGQGGGIAIEDAASLSAILRPSTRREDIPELLKLYESIRRDRAHKVQSLTRIAGQDLDDDSRPKFDILKFTDYNYGHDEYSHSTHIMNKWLWNRQVNAQWAAPTSFGPVMIPGSVDKTTAPLSQSCLEYAVRFKSSATYLKTFFPTESFSFVSPGTVADATFKFRELVTSDALGLRTSHTLSLHLHHVQYKRTSGQSVVGSFIPVYFASGDEQEVAHLGLPKIQCKLQSRRVGSTLYVSGDWRNTPFLKLTLRGLVIRAAGTCTNEAGMGAMEAQVNGDSALHAGNEGTVISRGGSDVISPRVPRVIHTQAPGPPRGLPRIPDETGTMWYNYVPSVGEPRKADAAYTVFAPFAGSKTIHIVEEGIHADVEWFKGDWTVLPRMHHVVKALAEIPMYSTIKVSLEEYHGADSLLHAKRIE